MHFILPNETIVINETQNYDFKTDLNRLFLPFYQKSQLDGFKSNLLRLFSFISFK